MGFLANVLNDIVYWWKSRQRLKELRKRDPYIY